MKKILLLFLFFLAVQVVAQDSTVIDIPVVDEEGEVGAITIANLSLTKLFLNSLLGFIAFHVMKVVHTIGVFDVKYWWKTKKIYFFANIFMNTFLVLWLYYSPSTVSDILSAIGVSFTGDAGNISFFIIFTGVVYEFTKKLSLKGRVQTDGDGIEL